MNISRKQLYALGEPFGECATQKKLGGRIYGGGSDSAPADTSQTSISELPAWARGYAKNTLAKTAALTDPSQNPYQTYGGERIAGFQPLQNQAMNTMAGLDAGPQAFQNQIGSYMSPYMQNVVDIQKREAGRQSAMAGQEQAAGAVQRGAFGGSRDALMRSERERNLSQQMGDIQARGSQAAYDNAANQFRQGITQQSGLAQMQGQMGALQQQQAQRPLDMAYQDFINQQNQPYKQLGFMSDMIRGLPLGQQSTSSIYQAPPSTLQTLGGLGMGAYGMSKMMAADGGLMQSYRLGGSVTSQSNKDSIVENMDSIEELQRAKEFALNRRDLDTVQAIDERIAQLNALAQSASLQNGLGSAFDNLPTEQQENVMSAANGGIVAFAGDDESLVQDDGVVEVDPETQQQALSKIQNIQYSPFTAQQRRAVIAEGRKALEEDAGPSPYADYRKQIEDMAAEDTRGLEQAKGLAALQAAGAMLQGGNAIRGLGAAGSAFGNAYGQALQANKAQKRSLMNMRMNLAEAERKERMGLNREALALGQQAAKDNHNAQIFGLQKAQAMATIAARTKPVAAKPNFDADSRDVLAADLKATTPMKKGETDEQYDKRLKAMATREIYGAKGTKDITSRANITSTSNVTSDQTRDIVPGGAEAKAKSDATAAQLTKDSKEAVKDVKKSPEYLRAMKQKDTVTMKKMEDDARKSVTSDFQASREAVNPSAAPAPTPTPVALPPAALAQLKEGVVTTFTNGQKWKLQNGKPVKVN